MTIHFELPDLEETLRADYGNLNQAAKEALLIDAYRTGKLSLGKLAQTLGRSPSTTTAWLDQHRVGPSYSPEDLAADLQSLAPKSAP